jgi:hypothetical protein
VNRGLIDNLINLLLNTGGNDANQNTGPVAILSGAGCVEANVTNDLNSTAGLKTATSGGQTVSATGSNTTTGDDSTNTTSVTTDQQAQATLNNNGDITNDATIGAITGNNQQNMNTSGETLVGDNAECPKLAVAPSPTPSIPSPTPAPSGGGEVSEEDDGGDQGPDEAVGGGEARVAGAQEKQPTIAPQKGLMRFPVAGGEMYAKLLPGQKRLPWQLFVILSMGVLGIAWSFDRKARAAYLGRLP